jgi:hypothetical protein
LLKKILENIRMSKKKLIKKEAKKKTDKKVAAPKKVAKPVAAKKVLKAPKKDLKEAKKAASKKIEKKAPSKKIEKKVIVKKIPLAKKVVMKKTAAGPALATLKKVATAKEAKVDKKLLDKKGKALKPVKEDLKKNGKITEVDTKEKKGRSIHDEEEVPLINLSSKEKIMEAIQDEISDEITNLSEDYKLKDIFQAFRSINYFKVSTDECLEKNCDTPATTEGYCRYHYIRNWQDIKKRQAILKDGRLQDFVEDLVSKYPLKHLESILSDLQDEKSFFAILSELNIDELDEEGFDSDDEGLDDDSDIAFETRTTIKTALGED